MKEKPMISPKQAENIIYDMTRYSDHPYNQVKSLSENEIKHWLEQNGEKWRDLIAKTRTLKAIPFVENFLGYEWHLPSNNITVSILNTG